MTKSIGHLDTPDFHWPPMIGVDTTLPMVTPAREVPFDQSRWPTIVSTDSVFIVSATLTLFFGSPLALSTAAAPSKRERLAPNSWFHFLPEADSYPSPSCLHVTPVSVDFEGQVGAHYTPSSTPLPIPPT